MRSIAVIPASRTARPTGIRKSIARRIAAVMPAFAGTTAHPLLAAESVAGAAPSVGSAFEMLGSLILVLVVIFGLAWLARWMQGARITRGAALQLRGGVQLGAKEKAVLLQVGDQQFLVGVAPGHVSLLHRFDVPVADDATVTPHAMPSAFAERLRQALGGKGGA